ncbi:MAG: 50S ribosome-binding GTPase [Ruminococcus sp.]|nr:50S ribosome-binding GTPase [Ruminococcus sp.]
MNELTVDQAARTALEEIRKRISELNKINIAVVGKTGSGKSTLINSVFGKEFAKAAVGEPVTTEFCRYTTPDSPLAIYDSPGFDMSENRPVKVREGLIGLIKNGIEKRDMDQAIHCIWYCINTAANRVEPAELEWLTEFTEENSKYNVPVIVILTQSQDEEKAAELKRLIDSKNLKVKKVIPVLARDYVLRGQVIVSSYGLDELVAVMGAVLPDDLQKTWQHVQKAALQEKVKFAQGIIATNAAAAAAAGAIPIPFSDAAVLVPIQTTMIAEITAVFGIGVSKGFISAFISATIGASTATVLGRAAVRSVLKLIPVVNVAAGVVNAAVASSLTVALGNAYVLIMKKIFTGEFTTEQLETADGRKQIEQIFRSELEKK